MHEHEQDAARDVVSAQALYTRRMPGGGYVRVELMEPVPIDLNTEAEHLRGRIVVERRARARGPVQEEPVVVDEVEGEDANRVVGELFRIARDNAAIARRVLRWQTESARAD